ncbi:MAG: 2-oxoacid:acceptor oxidoreductase family protein [Deltaproteobacteria bacterium]|jgi:2-oxoglutarate ferredoxin oxidoreductase subunit gamma|nr:2-oxoacid:acceptor oxidoreductase family protein [Deltaproteobacteria bacterium]
MIQVRFAGLGGQGIILLGEILGEAAVLDKKYVGQASSYGSEARGSACKADVIISDSWIDYPEVTEADVLACMSQGTYEMHKKKVNPSTGMIFVDTQMVKPDASSTLKHILIPATERALKDLGNRMVANMVLLGAVIKTVELVSQEALLQSLSKRVPSSFLETNRKALALGFELAKS